MQIQAIYLATAIVVEITDFDINNLIHYQVKEILESKAFLKEDFSNLWKRKSFKNWDSYCFWKDEVEKLVNYFLNKSDITEEPKLKFQPDELPDLEKISEKIKKLLALSESPNEAEAMAAFAKAQEMLTQYQLSVTDLADSCPEKVEEQMIEEFQKSTSWKEILFNAIAKANYCMLFNRRSYQNVKQMLLGRPSNIQSAKIQYEYLVGAIEQLASLEDSDRSFRNAFRLGAANRLYTRIEEVIERQKSEGITGNKPVPGLIVRSLYEKLNAEVQAYAKANLKMKKPRQSRAYCSSADGFFAGQEAGNKISLNKQLGSGKQKYLPS